MSSREAVDEEVTEMEDSKQIATDVGTVGNKVTLPGSVPRTLVEDGTQVEDGTHVVVEEEMEVVDMAEEEEETSEEQYTVQWEQVQK